jgi:hypothetical protein
MEDMAAAVDLTGQKFGRLLVIRRASSYVRPNGQTGHATWFCLCDCGKEVTVIGRYLRIGSTTSCGCYRVEVAQERLTTHGMTGTPEFASYHAAKTRCTNPRAQDYLRYGGRGIEFRFNNFEEFYIAVGPKPEPERQYSLERIDNNGHYEPGNVKWATYKEQNLNRRPDKWRRENARLKEVLKGRNEVLIDLIIAQAVSEAKR